MVNSLRPLSLAALAGFANAKLYHVPEATMVFDLPLDQFSPQPTKAPAYADLRRRQTSTPATVLVAPDNTCGYISGRPGAAYTCDSAATCVFFTSSSRSPGRVACCDSRECNAHRTCYGQKQLSSTTSLCDNGCLFDTFTLKCTNSARPHCNTISFPGNVVDYWCNEFEVTTPQAAQTTYDGETGRSWAPLPLTDDVTSSNLRPPSASNRFTATATGPLADPSPSNSADNDNDSSSTGGSAKSSTPIGAIVGGVIGGLAVLALIGLGLFFILRKKKQQHPPNQPQSDQPQMSQGGGYPQSSPTQYAATTHTQSVYDPKFGGSQPAGYPQSYGGTPPPQSGYTQQGGGFYASSTAPDRADTTSPSSVSQMTDNRYSTHSLAPGGFQQQPQQQQFGQTQPTIHEAPASNEGHRGQMHELA